MTKDLGGADGSGRDGRNRVMTNVLETLNDGALAYRTIRATMRVP